MLRVADGIVYDARAEVGAAHTDNDQHLELTANAVGETSHIAEIVRPLVR